MKQSIIAVVLLVVCCLSLSQPPAAAQRRQATGGAWEYAVLYGSTADQLFTLQMPGEKTIEGAKLSEVYEQLLDGRDKGDPAIGSQFKFINLMGSKGWELTHFRERQQVDEIWFKRRSQ